MEQFMGRPIAKDTIALGLGGQIDRAGEEYPPRAQIKFEAVAVVQSVKVKFTPEGTADQTTVLVIDPATFRVRAISGPAQGELL